MATPNPIPAGGAQALKSPQRTVTPGYRKGRYGFVPIIRVEQHAPDAPSISYTFRAPWFAMTKEAALAEARACAVDALATGSCNWPKAAKNAV